MAKTKRNIGLKIPEGIREIKRAELGRVITVPPISAVRESTGLSQSQFAELLGVSVRTLQDWEQGRRAPSGAARTLLRIVAKNPRVLREVAWHRDGVHAHGWFGRVGRSVPWMGAGIDYRSTSYNTRTSRTRKQPKLS